MGNLNPCMPVTKVRSHGDLSSCESISSRQSLPLQRTCKLGMMEQRVANQRKVLALVPSTHDILRITQHVHLGCCKYGLINWLRAVRFLHIYHHCAMIVRQPHPGQPQSSSASITEVSLSLMPPHCYLPMRLCDKQFWRTLMRHCCPESPPSTKPSICMRQTCAPRACLLPRSAVAMSNTV